MPPSAAHRHGRTCSGHPRLWFDAHRKVVDARDIGERSDAVLRTAMRGHDEEVAQRNPWRHRHLVAIPDYAPLHPGYAFDCSYKNRLLRIFSAASDRFSVAATSCVEALRSNFSRQQGRCFNDLQGHRVPNSATAFDNRPRIVLKEKIPLTKGRLPEACREVERVRCSRADLQSAPGRFGYQSPGTMTGKEVLPGLGQAKAGNARTDRVPGSLA